MGNNYQKSIQLKCITCGDSNFEFNEDKTWIKCERCNREYSGGYDELVSLNKEEIELELNNFKKQATKDLKIEFSDILKNAVKKSKNLKFK